MKLFAALSLFILLTISGYSVTYSPQRGGNCYTLDIPDYMVRTYKLNEVASLQYQNISKEAYTIVISDSKEQLAEIGVKFIDSKEFLKGFTDSYMADAKNRKLSQVTEFEINGNKNAQTELTWSTDDTDYYMLITVVESKENFYKILCWTITENKDMLKNDFINISKSLKD